MRGALLLWGDGASASLLVVVRGKSWCRWHHGDGVVLDAWMMMMTMMMLLLLSSHLQMRTGECSDAVLAVVEG